VTSSTIDHSAASGVYIAGASAKPYLFTTSITDNPIGVTYADGAAGSMVGCTLERNGSGSLPAIQLSSPSSPWLLRNEIDSDADYSVKADGAGFTRLLGNTFATNEGRCVALMENDATLWFVGNQASGYHYDAIEVQGTRSAPMPAQDFPYFVTGQDYHVVGCDVAPGAVFKIDAAYLSIRGSMRALGSTKQPIIFTSIYDDSVIGDTNNDGGSLHPLPGDWDSLDLRDGCVLRCVTVLYGGQTENELSPMVQLGGTSSVSDCVFAFAGSEGLSIGPPLAAGITSASVKRCLFAQNTTGVTFSGTAGTAWASIDDCDFVGNVVGLCCDGTGLAVTHSRFSGPGLDVGVETAGSSVNYCDFLDNKDRHVGHTVATPGSDTDFDATYCYWGGSQGPTAHDRENIAFNPWSTTPCSKGGGHFVYGPNNACGAWAEPINTTSGNFYYSAFDLGIPGKGLPFEFSRTYNSQDAASDGPLGPGWTASFAPSIGFGILRSGDSFVGGVTVTGPDSIRTDFKLPRSWSPTGTELVPLIPSTRERLRWNADASWDLISPDQSRLHFDVGRRLRYEVDRFGNRIDLTYSDEGLLTRVDAPGGRSMALEYAGSHVTTLTDSAGRVVRYAYSSAGDLVGVTDPGGNTTHYSYDATHQITSVASPEHPETPFVRNVYTDGRVTTQYDGYDSVTTLAYGDGVTTMVDNRGSTVRHYWDTETGRLTSAVDAAGYTTSRSYDASGFMASTTDGNGAVTQLAYDAVGNLASAADPAGHARTSEFDLANNNLLWSEDEAGTRTTFTYDASGTALTGVTGPGGTTTFEHYTDGLLSSLHSADATTSFAYDPAGNLTTLTDPLGSTTRFGYDAAGRLTTATDALERSVGFTYDPMGHLTALTDPLGASVGFTYDADGNRTSATDAEGDITHYRYDQMDKLVGVTDAAEAETTYTYDRNYNLASVTDARSNTTIYTYAPNDRLTSVTDPLGNTTRLSYDGAGNLTQTVSPTGATIQRTYTPDGLRG
jgi:YD repeat-containing protein